MVMLCAGQIFAQNIYIDKPVLAGKLTCFPGIDNPNNYYFLPNQLRLGVGLDGSPQFSFLMFVKNLRGDEGEAAPREGEGGGVVHAVVELYVGEDQIKDAERELRKKVKNDAATIIGPVIYKSGTMSLISSIADPAGGYSKVVLGLGPAPVLAGNKAAVSILLNKEGAKILWETFKTPTPDLSFSFVMDVDGFRSPINAWIDVNFDKVYESQTIEAGLKYRSGGSGGNQRGNGQGRQRGNNATPGGNGGTPTPPAGGGSTVTPAPPAGGGGTVTPAPPAGGGGTITPTPPAGGTVTPTPPAGGGGTVTPTPPAGGGGTVTPTPPAGGGGTATPTPPAGGGGTVTPTPPAGGGGTPRPTPPAGGGGNGGNMLLLTSASIMTLNPFIGQLLETYGNLIVPEDKETYVLDQDGNLATYEDETLAEGGGFYLDAEVKLMFESMKQDGSIKVGGPQGDEKFEDIIKICYNKMLDMLFEPASGPQAAAPDMNNLLGAANQINGQSNNQRDTALNNSGGLGISVAYKFKSVRKTGRFRMDLNRSMTDALKVRFDENLGKIKCPTCFRQVNLDDPMFRQRAVLVSVDGMNSDQFRKYVNFVGVSMKKTHGNNEITSDEVRIGVAEMEKTGNLFRLQYGWKDEKDANKDQWLKYEYKTTWSFFGNQTIESPWMSTENFTITAAPPLRPVSVDIEASPDLLKQKQVRMVNVKIYYNTGSGERIEQVNIKADGPNTATKIEFVLPEGKYEYEYEITWRIAGNKEVKTPRTKSTSTFLYADEVPN